MTNYTAASQGISPKAKGATGGTVVTGALSVIIVKALGVDDPDLAVAIAALLGVIGGAVGAYLPQPGDVLFKGPSLAAHPDSEPEA